MFLMAYLIYMVSYILYDLGHMLCRQVFQPHNHLKYDKNNFNKQINIQA